LTILRKAAIGALLAVLWVISAAVAQLVINPPVSDVHINGHTYTNAMLQSNPAGWLGGVANDVGQITSQYPTGRFSPRVLLTSDLTMYISPSGSDSNNCLVGNPCFTIARAIAFIRDGYDFGGHTITVQLADGAYSNNPIVVVGNLVGAGTAGNLIFRGNPGNPSAVQLSTTASFATPVYSYNSGFIVDGMRVTSNHGNVIWADQFSRVYARNIIHGGTGSNIDGALFVASNNSMLLMDKPWTVAGSVGTAMWSVGGSNIFNYGWPDPGGSPPIFNVTISGSPEVGIFAQSDQHSTLTSNSTFTGNSVGQRFSGTTLSLIYVEGRGINYFPGTIAGALLNNSVYQ
jgi:hypothetical protein